MKNVWITALAEEQVSIVNLIETASKYGLKADGHFWVDEVKKMAWMAVTGELRKTENTLWVIAGKLEDLKPTVRYGLTLLVLTMQKERPDLSMLWVDTGDEVTAEKLPTILAGIPIVQADSSLLGAKLAAGANMKARPPEQEYRLSVHANPGFGVWFEVGPAGDESWAGAMLAVNGGEVKAHGAGPANVLPEKCVLEYPMEGLKLNMGETEYIGWAVSNRLDKESSYFVKVDEVPEGFLFGPLAEDEAGEVYVVRI